MQNTYAAELVRRTDSPRPATIAISHTGPDEAVRVRIEVGCELMDLDIKLADFATALTSGGGPAPALLVRRCLVQ